MKHIKIRNKEDEELIKMFAMSKGLPLTKAVVEAVRIANNVVFLKGKIATLQFMLRITKEENKK